MDLQQLHEKKAFQLPQSADKLAALESELGTQLLQRTTRQLALTEMGEEYYQQCKKTLNELFDAEVALLQSKMKRLACCM